MLQTIKSAWPRDKDYPERAFEIGFRLAVLDGKLYDQFKYAFWQEVKPNGEYCPVNERRPSVRYNLCRTIVNDSVGMLFSEGHFPEIECEDKGLRDALRNLVTTTKLQEVMIDAATRGSVGSVAIWFRLIKGRVYFKRLDTVFLTPTWDPEAPDELQLITEIKKVKGADLIADMGYSGLDPNATYWFRREWDAAQERWFVPWTPDEAKEEGFSPTVDAGRTVSHGLGFVPMVWIKNLPGGDDIDGWCTFADATESEIEIDYKLSHAGRGLRYSSDPILCIKDPQFDPNGQPLGGGNVLVLGDNGNAQLLEIAGTAVAGALEYVKALREMALEAVGGNRAPADKLAGAQSGRALEMMNHGLIVLADKLRGSYGEGGLKACLEMVLAARRKHPIVIPVKGGEDILFPAPAAGAQVALHWPQWYAPTPDDEMARSQALTGYVAAGIMASEDATRVIAPSYDIEDVEAAVSRAKQDRDEAAARDAASRKPDAQDGDAA